MDAIQPGMPGSLDDGAYQLDPGLPTYLEVSRGHDSIEDALHTSFIENMRETISGLIVDPGFDASQVPGLLIDSTREFAPHAVNAVVEREKPYLEREFAGDFETPMHQKITEITSDGASPILKVGTHFVEGLCAQIAEMPRDYFQRLQDYNKALSETKILEFFNAIRSMSTSNKTPDWLDDAYQMVDHASKNRALYTPPIDKPESLYILCFVDDATRQLAKRIVIDNLILARTEAAIGESRTSDEQAMLGLIEEFGNIHALSGQQWDDRIGWGEDVSEANRISMARLKAREISLIEEIKHLYATEGGKKVVDTWRNTAKDVKDLVAADAQQNDRLHYWETIDVGHGIDITSSSFIVSELNKPDEKFRPPKDGTYVAILEDDSEQMRLWREVYSTYTKRSLKDEYCSADPAVIAALADNPEISEFVLDVQNYNDKKAGIRVAISIVSRLLENIQNQGAVDETQPQPKKVKIWSSSGNLLRQASQELGEYLNALPEDQQALIQAESVFGKVGSKYRNNWEAPILLEIASKGIGRFDLN